MVLSFADIFQNELDAINYRRRAIQSGVLAQTRASNRTAKDVPSGPAPVRQPSVTPRKDVSLEQGVTSNRETIRISGGSGLIGLALSGGGIRSASFSLGVLQALDSLSNHDESEVLDAFDYISAVSGGGYIGTSLVAGLMQENATFPFDSRLDEQETPETQHLRDFSNFLAPNGMIDYLVSAALVLRGLLVNVVMVLPVLLLLAVFTIASNPLVSNPDLYRPFPQTLNLIVVTAVLMFGSAIYTSLTFRTGSLRSRENLGRVLGLMLILVVLAALFEAQPFVLAGMVTGTTNAANTSMEPVSAESLLSQFAKFLPALAAFLAPLAAILVMVAQKLANLAKASLGEATWTAIAKKYASRVALYFAAVIVPLLLWIAYIYLSFWAIRADAGVGCGVKTPGWLQELTMCDVNWSLPSLQGIGPIGTSYLIAAIVLVALTLLIGPNSNSLHRLYRDRLSRAFLFERAMIGSRNAASAVDTWKFSSLKPQDSETGAWLPATAFAPYLLTNTAINLEGSEELNKRGRNADTFIFSPLHVGSRWTGYVPIRKMEAVVPDLSLATAMAVSGAAASANMGRSTIKVLRFSLSLLNIRLGYWLANPGKLDAFRHRLNRWRANIGSWFFAVETAGLLNEKRLNVYLTDGGHIENLGIYELLRRRCKVIIAVDADADPNMTFPSLVNLEVMARIDLGVRIELPWQTLQSGTLGVTSTALYGPDGPPGAHGPHAAIGIIRYNDDERGVLIYIKSSLSGDENDYVLDYKRRNVAFPHETTIDQFFSEEQFEAYRCLGFHATHRLLDGTDDFAKPESPPPGWKEEVTTALELLNIPPAMRLSIIAHISTPSEIDE